MSDFKLPAPVRDPELLARLHLEYRGEPCWNCDVRPGVALHHDTFRSQGGSDDRETLRWLCTVCHYAEHGIRAFVD